MKLKLFTVCAILAFTCYATFSTAQCNNVTSGGTIGTDQTSCGAFNPSNITNITLPSGGTGTIEYQWQSSLNNSTWTNISGATLSSYDPSTISDTTYYKRLSRRSGCTAYDGVSNTVTKTVHAVPTASITPGGPTTFCGPGSVLLTANSGTGITYQWRKDNVTIGGATNQTYTAAITGVYTVRVTLTSTGCAVFSPGVSVNVDDPLTPTITNVGFTICGASTVMLQVQSGYSYTYQWHEDSYAIPNTNHFQLTTGHDGTYSCTVTNSCGSYSSPAIQTHDYQNSGFLEFGRIVPSGTTSICTGGVVELAEQLSQQWGWALFPGYQWYFNGAIIPGATNYSYVASQAGDYSLQLTAFDNCQFIFFNYFTNWITVTTSGNTFPTVTIAANGSQAICQGSSVLLTATASGTNITYQWTNLGTPIPGATSQTYLASSASVYNCVVTNSCGSVTSNPINITVLPISVSVTPAGPITICQGGSYILSSGSAGGGGSYQWALNGSNINGATQQTYAATQAGNYTVAITNSCGTFTSNTVVAVIGNCSTGLQFDGFNDFVRIPNNTSYNFGFGDFSVEGWIKMDVTQIASNYPALISRRQSGTGWFVFFVGGKLTAQLGGSNNLVYGPDLRDGQCHHVAVTRSGSIINFYVDGIYVGTSSNGAYNVDVPQFLYIGNDAYDNFNDGFKGKIMEVRLWNTSRTNTQIQNSMNGQLTGNEAGLVGNWRLDDGVGQVANDYSTVNNDGQLGITTSADASDPVFAVTCPLSGCLPPSASIVANGPTTFCSGGSVVLNANTGVGLTYQWRLNTNPISGATLSSYTAVSAGTYSCLITNSCSSTLSNSIVVTVNTTQSVFISAAGSTTFCTGGSVTLNANSVIGVTYQWNLNGSSIPGATSTSYNASAQGNYTCALTNICGTSTSNTISVTVLTTPSATITANGPTSFCNGSSVEMSANTGNGLSYQWSVDGNGIALATAPTYTATASGSYTCTVTNACGTATSNSIVVTVDAPPVAAGAISGSLTICLNSFAIPYSVNPVSGATSYTWTVPAGASISQGQGTNSIYVDFGGSVANGNICVSTVNGCGTSSPSCLALTTSSVPLIPNQITGSSSACANTTGNVYSVSGVIGATSYTWTLPTGASFVSGQGTSTITVSFGPNGATGSICVYAGNACGTNFTCKQVTAVTGTTMPASISGTTTPCANSSGVSYSCPQVAGASSYVWTVPASATITGGQGTTSITVNFNASFSSGTIGVSAVNCAGTSPQRTLQVYGTPVMPGTITGPSTAVCGGTTNVQYSIAAVPGATSYTWTAPGNASITSGQGTTTVRLNFGNGFSAGTLSVRAVNSCGTSAVRTLAISSVPPMPGAISGPATFCANSNVNYSVAAVSGATTYQWVVPSGASITSGQGTTTITVHHGTHSGKIKVRAGNACGYSSYQIKNVTKTCREGGEAIMEESVFDVTVFPNPSSNQFTISVKGDPGEKYDFILRDLTGRIIEIRENQVTNQLLEFGASLLNGIYIGEIVIGKERKWVRIIKSE